MTAIAALCILRLQPLIRLGVAAAASCVEAVNFGMDSPYMPFVHEAKHHEGQIRVANLGQTCVGRE